MNQNGSTRSFVRTAPILAAVLFAGAAGAQTQQQIDACSDDKAPLEQQISGCSAVIESSPSKDQPATWAYINRGFASERTEYLAELKE